MCHFHQVFVRFYLERHDRLVRVNHFLCHLWYFNQNMEDGKNAVREGRIMALYCYIYEAAFNSFVAEFKSRIHLTCMEREIARFVVSSSFFHGRFLFVADCIHVGSTRPAGRLIIPPSTTVIRLLKTPAAYTHAQISRSTHRTQQFVEKLA